MLKKNKISLKSRSKKSEISFSAEREPCLNYTSDYIRIVEVYEISVPSPPPWKYFGNWSNTPFFTMVRKGGGDTLPMQSKGLLNTTICFTLFLFN